MYGIRCARAPEPASVGGTVTLDGAPLGGATVFVDLDGDAAIDSGEPSTTTSVAGAYTVTGVPKGTVDVRMINPSPGGIAVVSPAAGYHVVAVVDGEVVTGLDFAFETIVPPASVAGSVSLLLPGGSIVGAGGVTVFADLNADGVLGSGEPSTKTTDPVFGIVGDYVLAGIPAGAVDIRVENSSPQTFFVGTPAAGFHSLVVADGMALKAVDFIFEAYPLPATVDGVVQLDVGAGSFLPAGGMTVFADLDGNGVLDAGEPSALTEESPLGSPFGGGEYHLAGIPAGAVDIRLVEDSADFFIAEPATGFYALEVADGDELTGHDFILQPVPPPAVIEGHVWVKLNGLLAPLGEVTVFADLDGNGVLDAGEPSDESTKTDTANPFAGGVYRLEGIPAGKVDVRVDVPSSFVPIDPTDGVHSVTVADGDSIELDFSFQFPVPPPPDDPADDGCAMAPRRATGDLPFGWMLFLLALRRERKRGRRGRQQPK